LDGTEFQLKIWEALIEIPAKTTTTYADIAEKVGKPKAVRAVGTAVGANPIAYLIPCHRVIRTDGTLGGYRWGLDVKKKMLAFEKGIVI
jgi:AraC family transcriptional regulator of adaptative response/methylated-DNA-[protein]-cysteine methyltransferase